MYALLTGLTSSQVRSTDRFPDVDIFQFKKILKGEEMKIAVSEVGPFIQKGVATSIYHLGFYGGGRRGRFEVAAYIRVVEIIEGAGFRGQIMNQKVISDF